MQIKIYFDEIKTSPRDLVLELVGQAWGTHELNNQNEYVSASFEAKEFPVVVKIIKKHLK